MCPWSVADISDVELKVPELSRLRNQARTGYSQGVPKKLQKSRLQDGRYVFLWLHVLPTFYWNRNHVIFVALCRRE